MNANVPTIDIGSAMLGITVADTLRRNRKITITTSARDRISVNSTSSTDARIETVRSNRTLMSIAAGTSERKVGSSFLIDSTTSMVLVPGWRWIARTIPRLSLNHAATLSSCTLSMMRPRSPRRTGEPLR